MAGRIVPAPHVAAYESGLRTRYPRFRLIAKERSPLMWTVAVLTGMRWWNPLFMSEFTTTIGYRVYMPARVAADPVAGVDVLRHEAVHLDQFRRHPVWFPLSYLLVPPALWTMRARWEREAYAESMRAEFERTGDVSDATIERFVRLFAGPAYLFMDVRAARVRAHFEGLRTELRSASPGPRTSGI